MAGHFPTAVRHLTAASLALAGFAALTLPASAHHSFAMFDRTKLLSYSGTIKEFEFTNPHGWLHVMVRDPKTQKDFEWSFEMGGLGQLAEQGIKADSLKPGDKVTVEAHPLKD